MSKAIALIDCNNFYASCEKMIDPSLLGKPLVVLSNNDGCIISRSVEARNLKIPMGEAYYKIRQKLEQLGVHVRSSNYALYGDMSQRLMSLIKSHCEEQEIYSIDEAFVQLTRPSNLQLNQWARHLRALVQRNLGLPIAIGIGASKGQAKAANYLAKTVIANAGIFDLNLTNQQDKWLENIAIEKVWGVGKKYAYWFRMNGIKNARQLRDMSSNELQAKYGIQGIRLQYELRGKICIPISSHSSTKKETCVSRSFSHAITNRRELCEAISTYVVRASEKLRRQKQRAGALTIFACTTSHIPNSYTQRVTKILDSPSNNTKELLTASLSLINQIFNPNYSFRKAGVIMQKLESTDYLQPDIFNINNKDRQWKEEKLMEVVDKLNNRYGHKTITWCSCGINQTWTMRQENLSKAATTKMNEIPTINA